MAPSITSRRVKLVYDQEDRPIRLNGLIWDITERKQAEAALKHQHIIINGINRIFQGALTCETEEQLGETCLAVAEELTGSKFGFIGEINQEGNLDDIAISYLGWGACKVLGTDQLVMPKNFHVRGIYGVALRKGRSEIVNDPSRHPDSVGIPEGHPSIEAFMGVPLKRGVTTIGMIGLGNKEGGYTDTDREMVEALAPAMVEAFFSKRAEEALRQAHDEMEQRVHERTAEVVAANERMKYLTAQVLSAQEHERKRISMDLHDDLGQSLLVLRMQLNAMLEIPLRTADSPGPGGVG